MIELTLVLSDKSVIVRVDFEKRMLLTLLYNYYLKHVTKLHRYHVIIKK